MRRSFFAAFPIITLSFGILLGTLFPSGFLVLLLCILMLIVGVSIFCN